MFLTPDPEQVAAYEAEQERRQMEVDAGRHEMFNAIESMNLPQLNFVINFAYTIIAAGREESVRNAAWWQGHLESVRERKFDVCRACRKNHADELGLTGGPSDA